MISGSKLCFIECKALYCFKNQKPVYCLKTWINWWNIYDSRKKWAPICQPRVLFTFFKAGLWSLDIGWHAMSTPKSVSHSTTKMVLTCSCPKVDQLVMDDGLLSITSISSSVCLSTTNTWASGVQVVSSLHGHMLSWQFMLWPWREFECCESHFTTLFREKYVANIPSSNRSGLLPSNSS